MKDNFFGYYPPSDEEINEIWNDSIIALDANTLLNLYRYTKSTREDFFKILKEFSERLWLPYQAGYEFHNNRISVIKSQEFAYREISKELDEEIKLIADKLNKFKRHPFIKVDSLLKQISTRFEKLKNDLDKLFQKHPDYLKSDMILPEITELFNGKIGVNFSDAEFEKIYKEGEERYEKNIPPGFSDRANKKKKGNQHLYGDLIIWKQLISYSKQKNKTIIFITDDRKEDWWLKFKGETIRPKEELIKEFYDETGFRILIYQADVFLSYANKRLEQAIKSQSIEEVKEVRLEDESKYVNLYNLQSDFGLNNNSYISFNGDDGIYLNPLSGSTMDYLKNSQNVFSTLNESPSWLSSLDSISKISEKPDWLNTVESISKLTEKPSWMDILESITKLTERPSCINSLDSITKLTEKPSWIENIESIPKLTETPSWLNEKINKGTLKDSEENEDTKDEK